MELTRRLEEILAGYDRHAPLEEASTIPADWYTDSRVQDLERRTVFSRSWQVAARVEQLQDAGRFVTCELPSGEPIVLVRGSDGVLRGFFNVCRHHAAAVVPAPEGTATNLRCPYHGWTYGLDGALKGTPDFSGVCNFDRSANGLVPVDAGIWEQWVFVRLTPEGPTLDEFIGADLKMRFPSPDVSRLQWMERRSYTVECNRKVFVDNNLDRGYHLPHQHRGHDSVLD